MGLADARSVFMEGFVAGIKPLDDINIWQWSDKYRVLAGEGAAEPGKYRTDRTPYMREILECLSPQSEAAIIAALKPTQFGFTEGGNNWFFHTVDVNPGPFAM